ncbi:MAG: UDP-N-acetylmuramoyl-tripeptide--D-alanyl-D-alanine ligase [Porphyromonas sp.]|nr:UDP-N-acetylmuramoyl-tripeptide--D-alanyl-D-alanine ligase [Porphyromonas sp.]
MDINQLYSIYLEHPEVCIDSRRVHAGCLFFALKGSNFDGNKFAAAALSGGATCAVVDDPSVVPAQGDHQYIVVDDSLLALQQLAHLHRQRLGIPVLGITGTNGKTTTKELVTAVLRMAYNVLATEGNLNNQIGVPLTLLRLKPEHQIAIIEMGASHPNDIRELVEIACPNYGIITNVGKAHLEGFGSIEGVKKTKGELMDYLRQHNGIAFVHIDDPILVELSHGLRIVSYGTSKSATFKGRIIHARPYTLSFRWRQVAIPHDISTRLVGDYNLPNALAAVAVGRFFDVATAGILHALTEYQPQNNRSQLTPTEHNTLIVDAYNANPVSMALAIRNITKIQAKENKVLILGDMRELGKDGPREHVGVLKEIDPKLFDRIYLVGPLFGEAMSQSSEDLAQKGVCYKDVDCLIADLRQKPIDGSLILIKGSNSIQLEKIVPLC